MGVMKGDTRSLDYGSDGAGTQIVQNSVIKPLLDHVGEVWAAPAQTFSIMTAGGRWSLPA